MPKNKLLKCLLVGDKAAGKATLQEKFCLNRFPKKASYYKSTLDLDFSVGTVEFEDPKRIVTIQLWSSKAYLPEHLWKHLIGAEVGIICINITNDEIKLNQALKNIDSYVSTLLQRNITYLLLIATGPIQEFHKPRIELLENVARDKDIIFYGAVDASIPHSETTHPPVTTFFRSIAQLSIPWAPQAKNHARTTWLFRAATIAVLSLNYHQRSELHRLALELVCEVLEILWNTMSKKPNNNLGVKSIDKAI